MADRVISAVAAFPWVHCVDPIEVGPVRILPYRRGALPGDLPHAKQTDIDAILGAYATRPKVPITRAALLEVDDWLTGMDAEQYVGRFFRAREAIGFAALAKRRLFIGHLGYCNYDTYSLVVQRYEPGKAGLFAFNTRRRDGQTGHMWTSDEFAFHRPNHVDDHAKYEIDRPLLAALMKLTDDSALREAVREFNSANTDSNDVPEYVELVMVKSAFEWVLQVSEKADDFAAALQERLANVLGDPPDSGPMAEQWRKRWPKAKRPLEAWVRDFCDVRNSAAHGSTKTKPRFVWQMPQHLAFASVLFPLVLKKRLLDDSLLALDEDDREQLKAIEELLMVDPFSPEYRKRTEEYSHPWVEFQDLARFGGIARRLYGKRGEE